MQLPLAAPLFPNPALFCDYLPFIKQIVAADDLHEVAFKAALAQKEEPPQSPTKKRRSRRLYTGSEEYQRHFEMSTELLAVARGLALPDA